MFLVTRAVCLLLVFSSVLPRHVPRFSDLDSDEQQLYRAAYETPAYNHEEYEDQDLQPGKLDLLKDGLWAIKAKIKELKAFNKALVASMLSTKLKLKELLEYQLALKKQPHVEVVEKKPSCHGCPQAPPPAYHAQYEPQHAAPAGPYQHDPYYGH